VEWAWYVIRSHHNKIQIEKILILNDNFNVWKNLYYDKALVISNDGNKIVQYANLFNNTMFDHLDYTGVFLLIKDENK
jgi:hypothetical protein